VRLAFGKTLVELGLKYKELYVVEVASNVIAPIFAENFPERFVGVDVGVQGLIGIAAGLAVCGKKVVVPTYTGLLMSAWELIKNTIGNTRLDVKLVGIHRGINNDHLSSCYEDFAFMRVVPNIVIESPADSVELRCCLEEVLGVDGPVYMRIGRDEDGRVYDDCVCRLGVANVVRDGVDVGIIATGGMVFEALKAAKELKNYGIDAAVLDFHTIKPLDTNTLIKYARTTGALVVAEEHNILGGLGSSVAETLIKEYPTPTEFVGVKEFRGYGVKSLEDLGLTASDIVRAVKRVIKVK
jgi:transketolase